MANKAVITWVEAVNGKGEVIPNVTYAEVNKGIYCIKVKGIHNNVTSKGTHWLQIPQFEVGDTGFKACGSVRGTLPQGYKAPQNLERIISDRNMAVGLIGDTFMGYFNLNSALVPTSGGNMSIASTLKTAYVDSKVNAGLDLHVYRKPQGEAELKAVEAKMAGKPADKAPARQAQKTQRHEPAVTVDEKATTVASNQTTVASTDDGMAEFEKIVELAAKHKLDVDMTFKLWERYQASKAGK